MLKSWFGIAAACAAMMIAQTTFGAEKIKALILDGQNNHNWKATTPALKWILEESGRFTVDVATTPGGSIPQQPKAPPATATDEAKQIYATALEKWKGEKKKAEEEKKAKWDAWQPNFKDYGVVISNYNGEMWGKATQDSFVEYVKNGGGFVSVHAADNSFPQWPEYNEMIGVGGWGGRSEKSGPQLRFKDNVLVRDETPGSGGTHGAFHEFVVDLREPEHPIVKGLPAKWMHNKDELYAKLRGPAKNLKVLASAYSEQTKEHEPMLMVIDYGKGHVFHTTMGHSRETMDGLGFQVTFARGAEWVATGAVTIPAPKPEELPADKAALRKIP